MNVGGGKNDATNINNNNNSIMLSENMMSPMKSSVMGSGGKGSKADSNNILEQSIDLEQDTNR